MPTVGYQVRNPRPAFFDDPDRACAAPGVDPDWFFPDHGKQSVYAARVCGRCRFREECGEWAISRVDEFGVWGGLSMNDRRRIRKQRREAVR